jgi:hypothetical protein
MPLGLEEMVASRSPANAGFGLEGGRAQVPYLCEPGQIENVIPTLLGAVSRKGDGRLARTLPTTHPRVPRRAGERISNIQGRGKPTRLGSPFLPNGFNVFEEYAEYEKYVLSLEMAPRPYELLDDAQIGRASITWTDIDASVITSTVAYEWLRFCDFEVQPSAEVLTAKQGQCFFAVNDTDLVDTPPFFVKTAPFPHGFTFPGAPRIYYPKAVLKVRWFQVPEWPYVTHPDSYLSRFVGRVNNATWAGYKAGQLLYQGFTSKRYAPAVPAAYRIAGGGSSAVDKLCDLELNFEVARRKPTTTVPSNTGNKVYGGHNLQPLFAPPGGFYATVFPRQAVPGNPALLNDPNGWRPTFDSCPFELLFSDPLVP